MSKYVVSFLCCDAVVGCRLDGVKEESDMTKDYKGLLKYLGLIFIAVLLTYKLPRDSYSIMQYIIKPIRFENSILLISAIVPLVLFIVAIKGLFKTEPLAQKSKIAIFIIVLLLIIPLMKSSLDIAKNAYFWTMKDELKSIDITDSKISFSEINDNAATLNVRPVANRLWQR